MNKFFLIAIAFALGYFTAMIDTQAQTTYLYGNQGQSLGTVTQSGNTQYFYGPTGESQGTATRSGNTTYIYGPTGQSVGTVMAPAVPMVYTMPSSLTPIHDSIFGK
jgi:glutamate synthase domain-containing protein 3